MTGFFTTPRIAWGVGAIQQLSGLSAHSALVVVDPAVAELGPTRRASEELAKSETTVEVVVAPENPERVDRVEELADRLRRASPDWVVVIGGGRTIDGVKAARSRAERPDLRLEPSAAPPLDLDGPPRSRLVAVPTTAGSGSEASSTVDLLSVDGRPFELAHRAFAPEWALLDPTFVTGLPRDLLLDGALETAAQAIEAYLSAWANPFSDALAIDALATVLDRLPHALRWSDDPEARSALFYASTAAGLATSNAQRGVAHALARALGPPTGLSYGRLLTVILPSVLEFDRPSARDRWELLSVAAVRTENAPRLPLPTRLERLYETFRLPSSLATAGIDAALLAPHRATIVGDALRSPATLANPRVPSEEELSRLLERLTGGGPAAR